jgi:hypothetical protein
LNIPKIDQSTKIIILVGFLAGILSCLTLGDAVFYKEAPVVHAIMPDQNNISHGDIGGMVILSADHPTNEQEFNDMLNRTGGI